MRLGHGRLDIVLIPFGRFLLIVRFGYMPFVGEVGREAAGPHRGRRGVLGWSEKTRGDGQGMTKKIVM
jgi:hypothetical protein